MIDYWVANKQHNSRHAENIRALPVFKGLGVSEYGSLNLKTMSDWLDYYRRKAPNTPYKMYVYDYQLSGSYYNAVVSGVSKLPAL